MSVLQSKDKLYISLILIAAKFMVGVKIMATKECPACGEEVDKDDMCPDCKKCISCCECI